MYVNLRRHIVFQDTVDFRGDFAGYGARYPAVQVNLTACGGSLRQRRIFDIKGGPIYNCIAQQKDSGQNAHYQHH